MVWCRWASPGNVGLGAVGQGEAGTVLCDSVGCCCVLVGMVRPGKARQVRPGAVRRSVVPSSPVRQVRRGELWRGREG